jgi:hypothetical protein
MSLEMMRRLAGDRASDTLRRSILHGGIGRLLDDGLRDLGVRVPALVQRAACECSDACRCCQLPANALALPLDIVVVQIRQNIHTLRSYEYCVTPPLLIYIFVYKYVYDVLVFYSCFIFNNCCLCWLSLSLSHSLSHSLSLSLSLSLFIYIYIYIYIYTHVHLHIHIHVHIHKFFTPAFTPAVLPVLLLLSVCVCVYKYIVCV